MTTSDPRKNIVILGASYAGISTAHYLLKHVISKLQSPTSYQVILVSPSEHVMCRPACPRALISDNFFDQGQLFVPIKAQFKNYGEAEFRFVHAEALEVDTGKRTIKVKSILHDDQLQDVNDIDFHALIIATGTSTPSPLLGLNGGDRDSLRQQWTELRKVLPDVKSIVIAGGGPAGVETAGELGEYLNGHAGWFNSKLQNPKVEITIVCASNQILPALRAGLANKAETMLAKVGVTVKKDTRAVSISPPASGAGTEHLATRTTVTLSNGDTIDADLYIPATGTRPNTGFLNKSFLAIDGRVKTNSATFRLIDMHDFRIYSVGDCSTAFVRPSIHNILSAIPVLCSNIRRDLLIAEGMAAQNDDTRFTEDLREMQLVPIGRGSGVGAAMGWAIPGWMVWLIKGRDYWLWTTGNLWSGKQWAKEG